MQEHFLAGREQDLSELIRSPRSIDLSDAACIGIDPDTYHPDETLDELSVARCASCPVRLPCLAYAMAIEDPAERAGWYGGLGPRERTDVAAALGLAAPEAPSEPALQAVRLRATGLTVGQIAYRLSCSRRTVQRYCRNAAEGSPQTGAG